LPSGPDEQVTAFDAFANALFSSGSLASLHVDVDQPGASVEVDGVNNLDALVPGEHWLVVKKAGFVPFAQRVTAPSTIAVVLVVDPNAVHTVAPAGGVSIPVVAAGIGGGLVVVGGVAAVIGYLPLSAYNDQEKILADIDARKDTTFDSATVTQARLANAAAQRHAGDWDSYGQPLFFGGLGAVAVGAIVAGVAGTMALLSSTSEEPAAPAPSAGVTPAPPR
jgi:hypothetical protein